MPVKLKYFINILKRIQDSDRDNVVGVSGFTGEGKSTFAVQCTKEGNKNKFSWDNHLIYTRKETIEKIKMISDYSFIDIDEAINVLYRRDFARGQQKELLRLLDMCRDKKLTLFFLIPDIWDLDSKLLRRRMRFWVYIDIRGIAYVFRPDTNPFIIDPWHRSDNEKLLKNWMKGIHPERSPNFLEEIHFEDLTPEDKIKYLETKARKKAFAEKDEDQDTNEHALTKKAKNDIVWNYLIKVLMELPKITRNEFINVAARHENLTPEAIKKRIDRLKFRFIQRQTDTDNNSNKEKEGILPEVSKELT
jgi:hypothetical protein